MHAGYQNVINQIDMDMVIGYILRFKQDAIYIWHSVCI